MHSGVWSAELASWLSTNALDGAIFAACAWLASVTLLRRASARVIALVWMGALAKFAWVQPFEMQAVPQRVIAAYNAHVPSVLIGKYHAVAIAYAVIVALLLVRAIVRHLRLRARIALLPAADSALVQSVESAARAMRCAPPEIRIAAANISPCIVGPLRPVLVLPRGLCTPGTQLDAVLLHELAHLAHRDHWFLWLERLVRTAFFFWPPVHWVALKLGESRELACDERAIASGRFSAVEYAQHLVDLARFVRERGTPAGALAVGRSGRKLERRIDRLLESPNTRQLTAFDLLTVIALAVGLGLGLRPAERLAPLAQRVAVPDPAALSCVASDPAGSLPQPCRQRSSCGQCIP